MITMTNAQKLPFEIRAEDGSGRNDVLNGFRLESRMKPPRERHFASLFWTGERGAWWKTGGDIEFIPPDGYVGIVEIVVVAWYKYGEEIREIKESLTVEVTNAS